MLSKEVCLEQGGHCWQDSGYLVRDAVAGALAVGHQYCKHCPAQRKKVEQPQWRYEEIDDRF